jgi:hypothetical protein
MAQEPSNKGTLVDFDTHKSSNQQVTGSDYVSNQGGLGSEQTFQCVGGLSLGNEVQVSRPATDASMCDPVGIHVPQAIREKNWAGSYIDLALLLKQARDLRTDPHTTGDIAVKNGQLAIEKQHLKPIQNIQTWTTAFTIYMSI